MQPRSIFNGPSPPLSTADRDLSSNDATTLDKSASRESSTISTCREKYLDWIETPDAAAIVTEIQIADTS